MSAFICSYEVIDNILSVTENYDLFKKYCYLASSLKSLIGENVYETIDENKRNELGREFLKLNIKSVNFRYNETTSYDYAKKYTYKYRKVSLAQSIKSLACLMYQSCEIKNFEKNKTYKKMIRLKDMLVSAFLYTNKEYEEAEWG